MAVFSLPSLLTWRNAAILFALLNLKALPFIWHLRLFRNLAAHHLKPAGVRRALALYTSAGGVHPLFESVRMSSRAPLLECDYNLHKSNATFFTDLDVSRTGLATRLLAPALHVDVGEEGKGKGAVRVILGAVHCSYHREVRPYEKYEVRSRLLGWDDKWLVIGSWFVRPAAVKGGEEQILASALSKYVVKKGRWTVAPERALRTAGWLPSRPEGPAAETIQISTEEPLVDEAEIPRRKDLTSPLSQEAGRGGGASSIISPIPEKPLNKISMIRDLEDAALNDGLGLSSTKRRSNEKEKEKENEKPASKEVKPELPPATPGQPWGWEMIEQERLRGLRLAEAWMGLDKSLMEEALKVIP